MNPKRERLLALIHADKVIDEIMSKTNEEREKELADAGCDPKKENAAVEALFAKHRAEPVEAPKAKAEPPKVVPLAARRRSGPPWTILLAAAAVAILSIGYAWKTTQPKPEDDMANNPPHPIAPPSTAPSSPTPGLDIRGNPTTEATDDLVAHPPPRPCKPLSLGYVKIAGTISREGERFVFVPDPPACGPDKKTSLEYLELEPANEKVDLARFGVAFIHLEGRASARDGGAIVVRVERARAN